MDKNWTPSFGFLTSPWNWSPGGAPEAGDTLFAANGVMLSFEETIGSSDTPTAIRLIGDTAGSAPILVLWNDTLHDVQISNQPAPFTGTTPPPDYYAARYGTIVIGGRVENDDGGFIAASRGSRVGDNHIDVVLVPGATLVNNGVLSGGPNSQLTIDGSDGTVENNKTISASGGTVLVNAHLTGVGDDYVPNAGVGLESKIELNAAVDAGQTFHIERGVLQIDQPASFLGQVDLPSVGAFGGVFLEGLTPASWDVQGSVFELFDDSGARIDTLRLTTPQDATTLAVHSVPDPTYGNLVRVSSSFLPPVPDGAVAVPYHNTDV